MAAIVAITEYNGKLWWASLLGTLMGGPIVVVALSLAMSGTFTGIEAAILAFLVPVIILSIALSRQGSGHIAAESER